MKEAKYTSDVFTHALWVEKRERCLSMCRYKKKITASEIDRLFLKLSFDFYFISDLIEID